MKKPALAILILLIAALASWYVLSTGQGQADQVLVQRDTSEEDEAPAHLGKLPENGNQRERSAVLVTTRSELPGTESVASKPAPDGDWSLRVLVLDQGTRKPVANVRVGFIAGGSGYSLSTNALGLVAFRHVQEKLRNTKDARVGISIPLSEPVRKSVKLESLPKEPVVLLLPPTGRVAIHLHDERGRDVDCMELHLRMEAYTDRDREQKLSGARSSMRNLAKKGHATSGRMGLGLFLRLLVSARDPKSSRRLMTFDIPGPTRINEVVEQDLLWPSDTSLGARWPVITGRFVRNDGTPWVETKLSVYAKLFPFDVKSARSQEITTDKNGRFRLVLSISCPSGGKRIYHFRTRTVASKVVSEIDASRKFPEGVTDLGNILLDRGRLLVSGRVVGPGGQPISGARLRISQRVKTDQRVFWPTYATTGDFQSTQDGTFSCYVIPGHDLPTETLRLTVSHPGSAQQTALPFIFGQRNVKAEFVAGAMLEGSIHLGTELEPRDLNVLLLSEPKSGRLLAVKPDGSFSITGIQPGLYALVVKLKSGTRGVKESSAVRIEGIRILPGATNREPRLQDIRIKGSFKKLRIRIEDESGRPIVKGIVEVLETWGLDSARMDRSGLAVMFVSKLPVALRVSSYGYGVVELPAVSKDRTVKLRRGLRVRLVTNAKTIGKDPSYNLGGFICHVRPDGKRGMFAYGKAFPFDKRYFDAKGRLECYLPGPGIYEFRPWFFFSSKDNVGRGGNPKMARYPRFTVREDSNLQVFQIHIPEAAIRAEVERVRLKDTRK